MPVVGKLARMAKAPASVHRPDDVEDQAPLLTSPKQEVPSMRPRRLLFVGVTGVALVGACAMAVLFHGTQAGADTNTAAGLVSFADAETATEDNSTSESTDTSGSPESTKDFDLSGSLLDNVTHALVMDDTVAKGDDSMLSVKKGALHAQPARLVGVRHVSACPSKASLTTSRTTSLKPKASILTASPWSRTGSSQWPLLTPSLLSEVLNENSTLVQWDYKPTEKEAKGALNVKAGERVWLTGIKDDGKDWIFIVKPDEDNSLVNGFIPEWAVHRPNSTENSTSPNSTADAPHGDAESTKTADDKKKTNTSKN